MWAAAEAAIPDAVSITSFNEFGEGTQIEPVKPFTSKSNGEKSSDYGSRGPYLYMNITGAAARSFKQLSADLPGLRQHQEQQQQQQQLNRRMGGDGGEGYRQEEPEDRAEREMAEQETDAEL